MPRAFAAMLAGEPGTPQPAEGASYAPLTTEGDRKLDWNRPAAELRNRVRAWGRQGAVGEIDRQQWMVRRARVVEGGGARGEVGGLVELGSDGRAVQTGDGLLLLEDAEPLANEAQ